MANLKKRNILILFSSSDIGGAERSISRMALSNKDNSISYKLSTFGNNGPWSEWVENNGGDALCYDHSIRKLFKYIYLNKPDAIYIIGFRLSVLIRIFVPIISNSRLVHGIRWNPNTNSNLDKSLRFAEKVFGFLIDGYIVNSKSAAQTLSKVTTKNIALIYNGIENLKPFSSAKSNIKKIVTVANLSRRKGYEEYLKAIEIIIKKAPESQFIFLGKDNLNGKIQQLIIDKKLEENVQYLGFQENIEDILDNAMVFVLPSLHGEGCPTSILEAFSFSLPVVAYRIDGIPELVTNDIDGLLYDVGKVNDLAEGILSLLSDTEKSKKMGEMGLKKVKRNFLLSDMLEKHNNYFLGLK